FTITIKNITGYKLVGTSIDENSPTGTIAATMVANDPSETYSYFFTTMPGLQLDNNMFTLSGNTLLTNFVPNYETKSSYYIMLDGVNNLGFYLDVSQTISINDTNEQPTDVSLDNNSIYENMGTGTIVGALSTIDQDTGDTYTYTLVSGTGSDDNSSFSINGANIIADFSADYETKTSYTVRVRSTDNGGLYTEKEFIINIIDVNEGVSNITLSGSSLDENTLSGTTIGTLDTISSNTGATFTYSLVSGTGSDDNASFSISGSTLISEIVPNYESKNSYTIRIRSVDNLGVITEIIFIIYINNINEQPTDISINNNNINENLSAGTIVGSLSTTDEDTGNTYTYTLVSGTGSDNNSIFSINGTNLVANFTGDYETKTSYIVRVRSTDNGGSYTEKQITIYINDVTETSRSSGGGSSVVSKDKCTSGDYSPSYYDNSCGTKPKTTGTGATITNTYTSTGTIVSSTGGTIKMDSSKISQIIDNTFKVITYEPTTGEKYTIQRTKSGTYIVENSDGKYINKVFVTIDDVKNTIKGTNGTSADVVDFDNSFKPVVYVNSFDE
ncbi:MAG: cadherin repeat domain-containing protein, partial [Candidatus Gracilibacteria bacterium]|nr:cadherin repeat domain-containing protein [Candidatus Gracilibacteria bacterium]